MHSTSVATGPHHWHRSINSLLTIVAVILGIYIAIIPFLPQVSWHLNHQHHVQAVQTIVRQQTTKQVPIPAINQLLIPRLGMQQIINTGSTIAELRKGVWLIPHTSTPDNAGNTVIVGHRFTYAGPAVFYFLDKVQINDPIVIDWEQHEYTYKVAAITTVSPTNLSVEAPTSKAALTLYTCTPLWSAQNRLVIRADLEGVRS